MALTSYSPWLASALTDASTWSGCKARATWLARTSNGMVHWIERTYCGFSRRRTWALGPLRCTAPVMIARSSIARTRSSRVQGALQQDPPPDARHRPGVGLGPGNADLCGQVEDRRSAPTGDRRRQIILGDVAALHLDGRIETLLPAVERSSMTSTFAPSPVSARTRWCPTKPAPPVTTILLPS